MRNHEIQYTRAVENPGRTERADRHGKGNAVLLSVHSQRIPGSGRPHLRSIGKIPEDEAVGF